MYITAPLQLDASLKPLLTLGSSLAAYTISPGMAETIGSAGSGHPNLNLTPDEKTAYKKLLAEADPDGFGVVSGDVAVKFFEKTGLAPSALGEVPTR